MNTNDKKFEFVKTWVRESISAGVAIADWDLDGDTLTIFHEDDNEVEYYTVDALVGGDITIEEK